MRFMPSLLSSNSHRLMTALVDSCHKKVYKVKNCITDIDPEREKEEKEKAENQTIRANVLLNHKRENVNQKYTRTIERKHQLSTGYLKGALDEDDDMDYNDSRHSRRRFEEDLQIEAQAKKRIMNAKKGYKDIPQKSSLSDVKSSGRSFSFYQSDRDKFEYETEGEEDERSPHKRIEDEEPEYEESKDEEEEEHYEEVDANNKRTSEEDEEEAEEPRQKVKESLGSMKREGIESDEDLPRKVPTHRRMGSCL